jgi:hypothetical protein
MMNKHVNLEDVQAEAERAYWTDPAVAQEFGSLDNWCAWRRAEASGRVRILSRQTSTQSSQAFSQAPASAARSPKGSNWLDRPYVQPTYSAEHEKELRARVASGEHGAPGLLNWYLRNATGARNG